MVLCKYFQQGNCRFGTKCNNEHFDVKQIIKTDVESAMNGNQWPLSCFGPFKDKPSIPNFIEDQSFEEIRFLCYESRQKNFFEQFHLQFTKEVLEAKNKLKSLLQLTPEVVELVSKLYDAPVDGTGNGALGQSKANNPFGLIGDNSGAGGGNSIFGKPNVASTPTGNVFVGSSSAFGPAAASNPGGIFGSSSGSSTSAGAGKFGAALNTTFNAVSTPQNSIFGQTAKPGNSIFGGGTQQTSIFGQSGAPSGGLFGQAANTQQTAAVVGGGLFAQAAQQQQQQQNQPSLGLFGQAAQQTAPVFGHQQQNTSGIFSQPAQVAGGNLFMQPQQQQQQQSQNNVAGGGLFAAAAAQSQNLFLQQSQQQQQLQQQPQQQQQQQPANIFAQAAQQTQLQASQSATPTIGSFQQAGLMQQNLAVTTAPAGGVNISSTVYSRMEDLTAEEIEAFKADRFIMGKIPFSPPPKETVN